MGILKRILTTIRRYPSVAVSLCIILSLVGISIYTMISIPISTATLMWSGGSEGDAWKLWERWRHVPRLAQPEWTNFFRSRKLPKSINARTDDFASTTESIGETAWRETTLLTFDYDYTTLPNEMKFYYNTQYDTKRPLLTLTWIKPDGSETKLFQSTATGGDSFVTLTPSEVLGGISQGEQGFDAASLGESAEPRAINGEYALRVETMFFEETGTAVDGELLIFGRVYGLAGTDDRRRDLAIGLMWGTPIALMFGFVASFVTTGFGFIVAAIGAWNRGWTDATIQRVTEVSMMIPFLPTMIMVAKYYSTSIWLMLALIIAFRLFGAQIKTYRAMFLQTMNSQYIEAARAYGASDARIIFRYLVPRVFPTVLPRLILSVPLFVFLEASLALLGISDPHYPTWGKILSESHDALYTGYYHWALGAAFMLILAGVSFSMLGYTLDRIFNPKLRKI